MLPLFPQCAALSQAIAKHRHLASFQALEGISPWCTAAKGRESPTNPVSELPALCRCFYTLRHLIQHHMPMSGHTEPCPTSTLWAPLTVLSQGGIQHLKLFYVMCDMDTILPDRRGGLEAK